MTGIGATYLKHMQDKLHEHEQAHAKPKITSILDSNKLEFKNLVDYLYCNKFCNLENDDPNLKLFNKDLEIFEGLDNSASSILSKINKTNTIFGYLKLRETLANPIHSVTDIKQRQSLVKKVVSLSEQERNEIGKKLDILKTLERDVIWLLKPKSIEEEKLIDGIYFNTKYIGALNKFEEPLNIYSYFKIFLSPLYGILSPLVMMIFPFIYLKFFSSIKMTFSMYVTILKVSMFGDVFSAMGSQSGNGRTKLSRYFSFFLSIVFYIQNLFNSFSISFTTHKIINILHEKMHSFQTFCDTGLKLVKSLSEVLNLSDIEHPDRYIRDTEFETNPSLLSNKGKVLYANKNCVDYEKIKTLFSCIGDIDYIYSIYKLTEKFDTCFPTVIENPNPIIDFNNVYHPYLENKAVKNSITIGNKYPQNVLITGPNAGGKSTLIKSLGISLLMSQTIGIAFADSLQFTPFHVLNSYLNIPDCKGKESLFEAEMHRSLGHINQCKEMPMQNKSFIIMDEIFSSTNPNEGISGAYAIAKKMASFKNSVCIITTHFNQLTRIESDGEFKNYKIPCEYDSMNKITYPYKLMEGVSDQNIALELLLAKGFDNDIIETAKKISEELSDKEVADAVVADAVVADAVVADAVVADKVVADAVVADTVVADAVVADTVVADAVMADAVVADTVVADAVVADAVVADAVVADAVVAALDKKKRGRKPKAKA